MSKHRPETLLPEVSLTPWVGRLMLANAVLLVLFQTVLTAPLFRSLLGFAPAEALQRPWTFVSYMFVQGGVLQLAANLLLLFVFGPAVERRMGSRAFVLYYLYCGVGAAAFALGINSFLHTPPMFGATGAAFGIALAFAFPDPDAKARLYPFEIHPSARAFLAVLAGANVLLALSLPDGAAHLGYLGGLLAGYALFRIRSLAGQGSRKEPRSIARRAVMTPIPVRQGGTITEVRPALARPEPPEEYPAEEVDRVLDKISAFGIHSLTVEERRFLDEVSKRKRKDH